MNDIVLSVLKVLSTISVVCIYMSPSIKICGRFILF